MPLVGQRIDRKFVAGDALTWDEDVLNVPNPVVIEEAIIAFFAQRASIAIVWKHITVTPTASGEVSDTGTTGTGHLIFRLSGVETALIGANWRDFIIRVKLTDTSEFTVDAGDIRGEKADVWPVQSSDPTS